MQKWLIKKYSVIFSCDNSEQESFGYEFETKERAVEYANFLLEKGKTANGKKITSCHIEECEGYVEVVEQITERNIIEKLL